MRQHTTADGRSSRRLVILFVMASLGLLLVGDRIHPVASALSPIVAPIESVISGVADDLGATVSNLRDLPHLQSEIDALKKQNATLINQHIKDKLAQAENRDYAAMLRFSEVNPNLAIQPASVIAWSPFGLNSEIGINVGSDDGIARFMPVLDSHGFLVGHVDQVWRRYSEVMLISDPNSSVGAMDLNTHAQGLFETPNPGDVPRLDSVYTGERLQPQDWIVTDRLENMYPEGLLIGQITAVRLNDLGSTQYAEVTTAANLTNLEHVQVLRGFNPARPVCMPDIQSPHCRSPR